MFEVVLAVTIATGDIDKSEKAYQDYLGYEVVARQQVSADEASAWNTPSMVGRDVVLMRPASGKPVYLRFIETEQSTDYEPLTTFGWNATEFLVKDVDAMRDQLDASPFKIIGEPAFLTDAKRIKAMQAVGPSREVIYLTEFKTEVLYERYGRPTSAVDRPFILVIGAKDHDSLAQFYGEFLGHDVFPFGEFPVSTLSNAMGLPAHTTFPLSTVQLGGRFRFELDGYPDAAKRRTRLDGQLPNAMSMVTVTVDDIDAMSLLWRTPPRMIQKQPYDGRRTAVAVGPGGEWIEVVEDAE